MERRDFLKLAPALGMSVGLPGIATAWAAQAQAAGAPVVMRWVPSADLTILDPIWTTAYVTQNHGGLIFDTLYGLDAKLQPQPQMASGHTVADNGLQWTVTLRDGLFFHNGDPVLAKDVVASLKRWGARDVMGKSLMDATAELSAVDDKTVRFKLHKPFPLLLNAIARPQTDIAAIMPERLATTPATTPLKEMIGSGPFRFVAKEWVSGSQVVYEKFDKYQPRKDSFAPTYTAGPKVAYIDRVQWKIIPDKATAVAALQSNEIDGIEVIDNDFVASLRADPNVQLIKRSIPTIAIIRFNQLQAPFNNPALRRAVMSVVSQKEYMTAMNGSDFPEYWDAKTGFFAPESPMASTVGMENLNGPRDFAKASAAIKAAGYKGEKVVLIDPVDFPMYHAASLVTADLFKKIGLNVEVQTMDWGSAIQKRNNQAPTSEGGWSATFTGLTGLNNFDPAGHLGLRGNGKGAWFGWPDSPKLESLRAAWFAAPDLAAQQKICHDMQAQAFVDVPYIPLGAMYSVSAVNKRWKGIQPEGILFFNVKPA